MTGDTFKRRSKEAIKYRLDLVESFFEFSKALPGASVREWTRMIQEWEAAILLGSADSDTKRKVDSPYESEEMKREPFLPPILAYI